MFGFNNAGTIAFSIPFPVESFDRATGRSSMADRICPRNQERYSVDRVEQIPGLLDGEPGSLAVGGVVLAAADRLKGIQGGGVAGHQGIEEVPEGGQGLVLGRAVAGELVDEPAGQAGGDLGELKALILTPGEEAPHDASVGAAGVGIGDAGGEELIGGKQGSGAGALEDSRDRSVQIEGLGSGQKGGNNETKSIFWSAARATSSG